MARKLSVLVLAGIVSAPREIGSGSASADCPVPRLTVYSENLDLRNIGINSDASDTPVRSPQAQGVGAIFLVP